MDRRAFVGASACALVGAPSGGTAQPRGRTAKALGVMIPQLLLLRADEVIE